MASASFSVEIKDARFYEPGDLGYEKDIKEYLRKIRGGNNL